MEKTIKTRREEGAGRRAAFLGLMTALALLMGYVESLIPLNIGIPGFKIGLCNLVVLTVLCRNGLADALLVSSVRIVLLGFLFGNMSSILYSFAGGIPSACAMAALWKTGRFSEIGVSALGGSVHNLGQLLCAVLVMPGIPALIYFPWLCAGGCVAGALIGVVVMALRRRIPSLRQ